MSRRGERQTGSSGLAVAMIEAARRSTAKCHPVMRYVTAITGGMLAAAALSLLPGYSFSPLEQLAMVVHAQNFSQRTIQGKVLDDTETPVGGATVFLKNSKTRDVKSFTSSPDGAFRFAQVGMVDDYEVWAEHNKHKSPVKTVSSFDSRKQVEFDLKLK